MAARKTPSKGAKPDKLWRDAIRAVVHELRQDPKNGKKVKALRLLARKLVDRAIDGDVAALKEIGDRLDGRAHQPITGGDSGPVSLTVEIIDPTK